MLNRWVLRRLWKTEEERDKEKGLSLAGCRISSGSWFQRIGAVKVKDLFVILAVDGLDGRARVIVDDDLVLTLF